MGSNERSEVQYTNPILCLPAPLKSGLYHSVQRGCALQRETGTCGNNLSWRSALLSNDPYRRVSIE